MCARVMVREGYTHSFCTPHIWPSLPKNNVKMITEKTAALQGALENAKIPLTLLPGGEINLREDTLKTAPEELVSYAMRRQFVLIDLWAEKLPEFFNLAVKWFQSIGVVVVLAHPERMRAIQTEPGLALKLHETGVLLQGNLQCLSDPPETATRRLAERFLLGGRYFMLGSDLHNLASLPQRIAGLHRATELVGSEIVRMLTVTNPGRLLPREK